MKNLFKFLFVLAILSGSATFSQVGIGTTTPAASAMFDVTSTTKGFLPPRMTSTQMNAIAAPAAGLMVYCSNCTPAGLYTSDGSAWSAVGDTSGGSNSSGGVSATMAIGGTWIWGGTSVTRNIVINITNNSFGSVSWVNATGDLVLSGGNTGLTVGAPTVTGGTSTGTTTTLLSGVTGTVTFPVTGVIGNLNEITATWTKLALTVAGTKVVTAGSATFTNATNNGFVFSANASGVNVAGTLPIGTTISIPYTAGSGSYAAYTTPVDSEEVIPFAFCNDTAYDWTFGYSYPAGTFASSGSITATLITKKNGVITAWPAYQVTDLATINSNIVAASLVVNGIALTSKTIGLDEGGDAIRGRLSTSAATYDAAAVDEWVAITNAEYTLLQNSANVTGAGTYVASNTVMSFTPETSYNAATWAPSTITSPAGGLTSVPINNYIYAFRFKSPNINSVASNGIVRYNAIATGNFTALGTSGGIAGRLPNQSGGVTNNTFYSFVLKRPTQKTTVASTTVSFYSPIGNYLGAYSTNATGSALAGAVANAANMSGATSYAIVNAYQVLATPTKSW